MKVFFPVFSPNDRDPWVGIGYLVSYLRINNIQVEAKIYTYNQIDLAIEEVCTIAPDIVGISILQYNFDPSIEFIQKIKLYTNVFICIGNHIATYFAESIMAKYPQIDASIIGEGEETILELCNNLNDNKSLDSIAGLVYVDSEGNIHKNKLRAPFQDLDRLPFPDRSFVKKKTNRYYLFASRGCTGRCTFCGHPNYGNRFNEEFVMRTRSMQNVCDEIEYLVENHDLKYLEIGDSTFMSPSMPLSQLYGDLYNELLRRNLNIRFSIHTRSELITENVMPYLRNLMKVGLDRVYIGFESGNDSDLKDFEKISGTETNKKAIERLRSNHIFFEYGFIMFQPYSTMDGLLQNLQFLEQQKLYTPLNVVSSRLCIFSGTAMVRRLYKDGLLIGGLDMPITDQFGYHFKDSQVANAYEAINELAVEFESDLNDYAGAQALLRNYNQLKTDKYPDKYLDYKKSLEKYLLEDSTNNQKIVRHILSLTRSGETNIIERHRDQFDEYSFKKKQIWKKLNIRRLSFAKVLACENITIL